MNFRNGVAISVATMAMAATGALVSPAYAGASDPPGQTCVTATFDGHNVGGDTADIRIMLNTLNNTTPQGDSDWIRTGPIGGTGYSMVSLTGTQTTVSTPSVSSPFTGTPTGGDFMYQAPEGMYLASATATACKPVAAPPPGNGGGSGSGASGAGAASTPTPAVVAAAPVTTPAPLAATPKVNHQVPVGAQHSGRYSGSVSALQWTGLALIGLAVVGAVVFVFLRRRAGRV